MKMKDIRELTDAELNSKLSELRKEKLNLKIQSRTGQLEKTSVAKSVRRDIARVKTEQNIRLAKAEG
ncbi:MAG: 50S ribosomal protein L29 [Victivallaceae bacterium]|nr:50S ribosomal protein L29 [Victivallaceae bacterium]